jgi:hypothetical protein
VVNYLACPVDLPVVVVALVVVAAMLAAVWLVRL